MMLRDVARQSHAYFNAKEQILDGMLPKDQLAKYVGLVQVLSADVMQHSQEVKHARKLHVFTVLKSKKDREGANPVVS